MSTTNNALPHWEMHTVFPSLDSAEFKTSFQQLIEDINQLETVFDTHHIGQVDSSTVDTAVVQTFDTVLQQFNHTLEVADLIQVYLYSFISTDSRNSTAQARFSELLPSLSKIELLSTRFTAWIGSLDVETLIGQSTLAQEHAFTLRRAHQGALKLMSNAEEALASKLSITGSTSWQQMFQNFSSQLKVQVELDGEQKSLPLPAAQNLAFHLDRDVRARSYHAVLDTLKEAAVPMAAALNAIKGETLTLCRERGWESPLDMALFHNATDRATLDAMMSACREAFPDFQRYLKTRARALGLPVLAWYDQLVPLGQGGRSWAYHEATQFIVDQFGTYSDSLKQMAQRAFSEGWIDAEPRDGKSGGGFCMGLRDEESRILVNFDANFTSVGTLAHELGHAYHNVNLAKRTPLQKQTPMTLAETASTFCQKIIENAALKQATPADKLVIIDGLLEYATRVILGASSNFLFEQALFDKRAERELSVEELCALDVATQKETRGDAIDPELLHPYRWAYVPHFYGSTFYNFPYIFGLLFGLGLYAQYQADPDRFRAGYDDLLSSTGMDDAAELAARFGMDIRQPSFWQASLDVLRADVDEFEKLVDGA